VIALASRASGEGAQTFPGSDAGAEVWEAQTYQARSASPPGAGKKVTAGKSQCGFGATLSKAQKASESKGQDGCKAFLALAFCLAKPLKNSA